MRTKSDLIKERLTNMLMGEHSGKLAELSQVLKSDILQVLRSYMYIESDKINLRITADEDGGYSLKIEAKTDTLIDFGKMLKSE